MQTEQSRWNPAAGWSVAPTGAVASAQLVLVFGAPAALQDGRWRATVRAAYPLAEIVGCSTAGEIMGAEVHDHGLVATAIAFSGTRVRVHHETVDEAAQSSRCGAAIAQALLADDLRHVLVLSDGLHVNGSALVDGMAQVLPASVAVTGGLSADGDRFVETLVVRGDHVAPRTVLGIGFYGTSLRVGCGSLGGWDPFGPERLITRSRDNVLMELDGKSALSLYTTYLGEHASGLPATALLFPLSIRGSTSERAVVRTVLAVDAEHGTMTFAGDVPQGAYAQLMRANFDRLIDGAAGAAGTAQGALGRGDAGTAELALLISCVGRKLVLGQRIEEEVESVREVLGSSVALAGFYSYGEISPFTPSARCELHNQTMTITTFAEC